MTKHHSPKRPKPAGFTLVEVLVVISILLTLTGVCYTVGGTMIDRARIIESSANLRSLAVANTTYLTDKGCYCPADNQYNNLRWHGARTSSGGKFDPSKGLLSPYLGHSMQVNFCPLLKSIISGASSFEDGTGGYGYNAAYIGGRPGAMFDKSTKLRISAKPAQITDPGRTIMFTTTAYARSGGLQEYAYCEPPFWDFGSGPSGNRPSPSVHFRANGKALVAWCDGSVTAEAKSESDASSNPHGGDASSLDLGWFGPEDRNGYWNPDFRAAAAPATQD